MRMPITHDAVTVKVAANVHSNVRKISASFVTITRNSTGGTLRALV